MELRKALSLDDDQASGLRQRAQRLVKHKLEVMSIGVLCGVLWRIKHHWCESC